MVLADLLTGYGLEASPENITKEGRPDVLINMGGIKVVIEGRFSDIASLHETIRDRVLSGLADIGIALLYPEKLQAAKDTKTIRELFHKLKFDGAICAFERRIEIRPFENCSLDDIARLVNNTFHMMVQDSAVNTAVHDLDQTLDTTVKLASTSGLFFKSEALVTRLKNTLGITGTDGQEENDE